MSSWEEMLIEAIKDKSHSLSLDADNNKMEFVLNECKLVSIDYEGTTVKLCINLSPTVDSKDDVENDDEKSETETGTPVDDHNDVDTHNMDIKLNLLKESSIDQIDPKSPKNPKSPNEEQNGNETPTETKTKPKAKKKAQKGKKSETEKKSARPIQAILVAKKGALNNRNLGQPKANSKHSRQRSKTTDDLDTFSIEGHPKYTYYTTELTAKQIIRCQGFADKACRYKMGGVLQFGNKLKREDLIEFKVPLNSQRIFAYILEDCLADGTNGEINKVHGGTGKKMVRLFIRSQMDHGVHVKLHVWYK